MSPRSLHRHGMIRAVLVAGGALLACDQQKVPPLRGVPPAQAAEEQASAAFAPGTFTLFSASPRLMPKSSRQITLADGSSLVATYDRQPAIEGESDFPEGTPLLFVVRTDGSVLPLACPSSLLRRTAESDTQPLLVPFGDGAAVVYRRAAPNDRPTIYLADPTARAVIDTGQTADLIGRGATPDRLVARSNDNGQARVLRWDGNALVELAQAAVPSSASYVDEPAPGVIAWLAPLSYRRSDATEDVPLPTSLFGGQPFDGASLARREPSGSFLFATAAGVWRWDVEGAGSVVEIAPLPAFDADVSPNADNDFARTAGVRLVQNPYQSSLKTPRGGVLRSLGPAGFVVREIVGGPCASSAACDHLGETFTRDVVGEGANARAVQMFYPWLEGGLQRLVVSTVSLEAGGGGVAGASGSGGSDGGSAGAGAGGGTGGVAGSGGGEGGAAGSGTIVCPAVCPGACDEHGLCTPVLVDPGPIVAVSSSEVGNVGVLRPNAAGLVFAQDPGVVGSLFDGFVAATPPSLVLSNTDLYVATEAGVLWRDAFGQASAPITPAGARVVGVTPDFVYTAAPFGAAVALQRNKRPHGAAEIAACLPQTAGPTRALDVRDVDGGALVARGGEVYRYDGLAGGACETVPTGTLVLSLPTGTIDNLVYDPQTDRFHVSAGQAITTADSFGSFTLPLPAGRDAPTALAARKGSVFYVQATDAPGLPAGVAALVKNTDGAVETIAVVPQKVTAIAATDQQIYWIGEDGALLRVPR